MVKSQIQNARQKIHIHCVQLAAVEEMPESPDIPRNVLRFIAEEIDTVPQLETLLLLCAAEESGWSEEEVAARIYVSRETARNILLALQGRHLIVAAGDPPQYRYSPGQRGMRELISEVAVAYRHHLVPMATFIHSKASASVREFARAFDLKKDR